MSKKKYCYTLASLVLVIVFILLPTRIVSMGDYPYCLSIDQCECGASGFLYTKSLGFIKVPYFYRSCFFTKRRLVMEAKQREQMAQQAEQARQERLQKLYNSNICDPGWLPVDKHCEKCDSSEAFKVSESDCSKCNQYEELRFYDSQSGECKLKQ